MNRWTFGWKRLRTSALVYQQVIEENVRPSVQKLKLKWWWWTMQHDNDIKHSSKSTKEWLKRKKWKVLEWPNQSLDLNPEMMWGDGKQAVHAGNLSTYHSCKDSACRIGKNSQSMRMVDSYKKHLVEFISAKRENSSYEGIIRVYPYCPNFP